MATAAFEAPGITGRDSLVYDARGNVIASRTPLGHTTEYFADAIGRDTLVVSPIDTIRTGWARSTYDIGDRVTRVVAFGPEMERPGGYASPVPADSLTVTQKFDAEGRVTEVVRAKFAGGFPVVIGTWFQYDDAGRKTEENLVGTADRYAYDPAGRLCLRSGGEHHSGAQRDAG